jgi:predicted transcriptional regulator
VEEEHDEDEPGNLRCSARGIFYHVTNRIINASTSRQNRGILRIVVMLCCSCRHTEHRRYSGGQRVQQRMVSQSIEESCRYPFSSTPRRRRDSFG